ncbi:hypothetical protein H5410_003600 [Solanum commersonii]|uniref:Uncharacterized protein n=1 Tax=Solanum commersonii TaxID=4109 RepID=A0A9J6B5J5_SOLCO|nr:hypothetical protein H5410_003600 [Solanum commersonii]
MKMEEASQKNTGSEINGNVVAGIISLSFVPSKRNSLTYSLSLFMARNIMEFYASQGLTPLPSTLRGDVGIKPSSTPSSQPLIACSNFTKEKMKMSDDVLFEKRKWAKSDIVSQKKAWMGSAWN